MIGSLLFGLGTSLTAAVTTSPWQGVLLYGVLGGIGAAGVYAPTLSLIPLHFDKHLSLASGIAMSACFLGPAAGSPISQAVIDRFDSGGLAVLYGSLGLLCFGTAILIRPSSRHKKADRSAAEAEPEARMAFLPCSRPLESIHVSLSGSSSWHVSTSCSTSQWCIIRHAECALKSDTTTSSLLLTYLYVSTAVGSVITGSVGR
ncbi:monocarboxylate transporter 13-like [Oscarella lobularis]|uniref:monocarboxylate transporter 13-like n=1 Tax=Oscarella lobularis TaxID=121494 RepID=UPI003314118C